MNQHSREITVAPPSMPLPASVASEFSLTTNSWRVLVDTIFPSAKSTEAVVMALSYCKARNLDIFKKPIHIVPMWSSALNRMVETCWPSIAEIRTTAFRTGEYAGIDEVVWGPEKTEKFTGKIGKKETEVTKEITYPVWASVVVYRWVKGERCAFHTKIFWKETYAKIGKSKLPNDMWENRTYSQFDKCLEAAALRKAFPEEVGSMYAAEEMEGKIYDHTTPEMRVATAAATVAPDPDAGDVVDAEVEEVVETQAQNGRGGAPDPDDDVGDGDVVDHADDGGAPDPDAGEEEPESPRQAMLDKLADELSEAKSVDDVQKIWRAYDLDAKWSDGDADHKADLRIARGLMNQRDRELQKAAKK